MSKANFRSLKNIFQKVNLKEKQKSFLHSTRKTESSVLPNVKNEKDIVEDDKKVERLLLPFDKIPRSPYIPFGKIGTLPFQWRAGGYTYFHKYADNLHKKLGPIFVDNQAGHQLVFIADANANIKVNLNEGTYPIHIVPEAWTLYLKLTNQQRGIFFMDGEDWHRYRRILNKYLLKTNETRHYVDRVASSSKRFVELWKNHPPGENLDYFLYSWTLQCTGSVAFGMELNFIDEMVKTTDGGIEKEFIEGIFNIFKHSAKLMNMPLKIAHKLNLEPWKSFSDSTDKALKIGRHYVREGVEQCNVANPSPLIKQSLLYKLAIEENMGEEQVSRILVDLILAAADTTAHTAIFMLHCMGLYPEVRERARKEVIAAKEKYGKGSINVTMIGQLSYMRAIMKETLRLFPIAPFLTRLIQRDTNMLGYEVPFGSMVITSCYTMGRDKTNFTNPDEFIPERWLAKPRGLCPIKRPDHITTHDVKASVPFGTGARSCIGRRIAEMELLTLVSELLLNFDWESKYPDTDMIMRMISVPSQNVELNLKQL